GREGRGRALREDPGEHAAPGEGPPRGKLPAPRRVLSPPLALPRSRGGARAHARGIPRRAPASRRPVRARLRPPVPGPDREGRRGIPQSGGGDLRTDGGARAVSPG